MNLIHATATFTATGKVVVHFGRLASFPAAWVVNDNVARFGESIDMALIRAEERWRGPMPELFRAAERAFRARPGLAYNRRP